MNQIHIVTFKEKDNVKNREILNNLLGKGGGKIKNELNKLPRTFLIEDVDNKFLEELRKNENVISVSSGTQYEIDMAQTTEWTHGQSFMDIEAFHTRGYKGAGVKVGYLDTGAAPHEDLVYASKYNAYAAVYGGSTPADADKVGHGTSVAGIIGARNNSTGYVGIAPECSLYAVKVDDNLGIEKADSKAVIVGIHWLVEQGVKIVNCSFSGLLDTELETAMRDAYTEQGVLFICSAGNYREQDPNDSVSYPAKHSFVMAVAALRASKEPAYYSSRGPEVDIAAPADSIMTTASSSANKAGTDYTTPSTQYTSFAGTSCAAPHIAGLSVLYKQMYPGYTADQIRNLIETNVEDLGKPGADADFGKGMAISPWTTPLNYPGKLTSTAIAINGTSISDSLTNGLGKFYKFTPASGGRHTITVSSSLDLYGRVYDANFNQLAQDDDSAGNGNPKFVLDLLAGQTYYIKISGYSGSQTGSFSINISNAGQVILEDFEDDIFKIPFTGDWTRNSIAGNNSAGYMSKTISHNQTSQTSFKATVPTGKTAIFSFDYRTSTEMNDRFIVTVNNSDILNTSGTISFTPFQYTLSAGTHTITFKYVRDASGDGGGNNVSIDNVAIIGDGVTVSGSSLPGESFANAIIVSGATASGTLQDTKDLFFKYTAPTSGNYTFTTSASFDSYMEIIHSNQATILGQDDDGAGNYQPKVIVTLSAGQVIYAKVYGYQHGTGKNGPVTLNITVGSGTVPSTPSISATAGNGQVTLSISGATGATSFDVFMNGSFKLSTTSTAPTISGLINGTPYSFYVIAKNGNGNSAASNTVNATPVGGGGVTPTTITEDFADQNYNFNISGDWVYSTGGWLYANLAGNMVKQMQFTVDVPTGAKNKTLSFRYKDPQVFGGMVGSSYKVIINGVEKFSYSNGENVWKNSQTIQLGTGTQTIVFKATSGATSQWAAYVDDIVVSWS